jgi:GNAT superfamily N-acetyltransferase
VDTRRTARDERADFAAFLAALSPEQWQAPKLCAQGRVRDLVAHVISYDELDAHGLLAYIVQGRFRSDRINAPGQRPRSTPPACGRSFAAEDDRRIVLFTAAFVRSDCWYFSALFIDPADQGRGIGRQLPHHLFPLERGSRGQAVRPGRSQGCIAL